MTKAEIQAQYSQLAMQMGDLTFRIEDQTRSLELLKNTAIALRKRRDELQEQLNAAARAEAEAQQAQGASDAVGSPTV